MNTFFLNYQKEYVISYTRGPKKSIRKKNKKKNTDCACVNGTRSCCGKKQVPFATLLGKLPIKVTKILNT